MIGYQAMEEYIFSFANLYQRYLECRKHKRGTINALSFELAAEVNLLNLSTELQNKSYQPSRCVCFVVEKPKLREIIAADFRDRVVHHVLIERLTKIFKPLFIHDSYACRVNKGTHAAVDRLNGFIHSLNGKAKLAYYLQLDIQSFFINIDKNILYGLILKKVQDKELLWLAREVIFYTPADNYLIAGNRKLIDKLPEHKSLIKTQDKTKGLPIGNLTSQFFANVYLNELDQFIKHELKCRYYVRYCDDFILLDTDEDKLNQWKEQIREFLANQLVLQLNDNYGEIKLVSSGVDYLGYISRYSHKLVRKRVVINFRHKLKELKHQLLSEISNPRHIIYSYDKAILDKLRAVISSYLVHLAKADSYSLQKKIFAENPWLNEYFTISDLTVLKKPGGNNTQYNKKRLFELKPKYQPPKTWRSIIDQYGYYRHYFPKSVVLFQVGSYYEFYHQLEIKVLQLLRLTGLTENKRKAFYGFPIRKEAYYRQLLLKNGYSVLIVRETGNSYCRIKEREAVSHYVI